MPCCLPYPQPSAKHSARASARHLPSSAAWKMSSDEGVAQKLLTNSQHLSRETVALWLFIDFKRPSWWWLTHHWLHRMGSLVSSLLGKPVFPNETFEQKCLDQNPHPRAALGGLLTLLQTGQSPFGHSVNVQFCLGKYQRLILWWF